MTRWQIAKGDILDFVADGLICSANVQLNLSGGVGGAILLRYGNEMQRWLHRYLGEKNLRHLPAGECVFAPSCGTSYIAVAHAISIDGFYDTNAELIDKTYLAAINGLAERKCRSIVAACLGCGYGRFPPAEFAEVIKRLCYKSYDQIDRITLVTSNQEIVEIISEILKGHA
jgi:O-acetyl-ADP-ribose deacetylase